MRGECFITKPAQYAAVYDRGSTRVSKLVVIKIVPNGLNLSRYGFSVGRRVGKAVMRNRVRRRFREIMRPVSIKPGWDIVLIARPAAAQADFAALRKSILGLLSGGQLLVDEL